MKAISYTTSGSVLIQTKKFQTWVDVWITDNDVICNWNQNNFVLTDLDEVSLKKWQEKLNNFEKATDLAVYTLEKFGIILQDENGNWHQTEKYNTIKGAILIE